MFFDDMDSVDTIDSANLNVFQKGTSFETIVFVGGIHLLPPTLLPWGGFSLAVSGRSCATWHLGQAWGRREGIGIRSEEVST